MMAAKPEFHVLSLNGVVPRVRDYKKRKIHEKTKTGCLICKAKKVKCDESRPACLRCQRNKRLCVYGQQDGTSPTTFIDVGQGSGSYSVTTDISTLSSVTVIPFTSPSAGNGTSSIHLMHYFYSHWDSIFQIPRSHEILSLSKSDSLVRNIILAITASHLRHVSPGVLQHRIAEHFQQSLALQHYQKALDTPREKLGQSGVDALLVGAMLLNMLAFTLPAGGSNPDPATSWVFSPREDRLGWLALQAGFRPLMRSMPEYLETAVKFLNLVFVGGESGSWTFGGESLEGIPATWIKVFGLDDASCSCDSGAYPKDIFRLPVTILAQLRDLEPIPSNVFKNFTFLAKVHSEFRALLFNRDERALWLFGYWLGIMCRFEGLWWCDTRMTRDYRAVRLWLEKMHLSESPGVKGTMWREMMGDLEAAPFFIRSRVEQ